MDPRTVRAALLAGLIAGGSVAFFGLFLGFSTTGTLLTAAIVGVLSAVLITAASRRAETFESPSTPPTSVDDDPGAPRG